MYEYDQEISRLTLFDFLIINTMTIIFLPFFKLFSLIFKTARYLY